MRLRLVAAAELLIFVALAAALLWAAGRFYQPVRVGGLSMHPALHVGDIAIVAKHSRPTIGDVILIASRGHELVLHRVVGFNPDGELLTQGDANQTPDREPVRPAEVVGRAVVVVPVGALVERWRASRGYATISAQSNSARP
jgi:signal peptidase I